MKSPQMTLFRAVVVSIVVGLITHFAVSAWAGPKKKPRKATKATAARVETPQIYVPPKQCYPQILSLSINLVPNIGVKAIANTYQYNCQGGTVYGCSVSMAEIVYISSGGAWVEIASECTTLTQGCLTTNLRSTNSAIDLTILPAGNYLYAVGFYNGACGSPVGMALATDRASFSIF